MRDRLWLGAAQGRPDSNCFLSPGPLSFVFFLSEWDIHMCPTSVGQLGNHGWHGCVHWCFLDAENGVGCEVSTHLRMVSQDVGTMYAHCKSLPLVDSCAPAWLKRETQGQRERRTEALFQLNINLVIWDKLLSSKSPFDSQATSRDPKF